MKEVKCTIPRVESLLLLGKSVFRQGKVIIAANPTMEDLTTQFIFGNGTQPIPSGDKFRPEVPLYCATEYCAWEDYETLGVCGTCKDMVEPLTWACQSSTIDWSVNSNTPEFTKGGITGLNQTVNPNGTLERIY